MRLAAVMLSLFESRQTSGKLMCWMRQECEKKEMNIVLILGKKEGASSIVMRIQV